MPNATDPGLSRLDLALMARVGSLELIARTVVEGFLVGLHRSPFKGFSAEFSEYRQYLPGDDPARIDWKVVARSDRYYIKRFEEDTNLDCHLLLDVSASMGYASRAVTKLQYGALLAAALAYLMHRQRDAVGLSIFDDRVIKSFPVSTRRGHLRTLLAALSNTRLGVRSDVSKPLDQLAARLRRRGLVVLLSDLLDEPNGIIQGLKHLRFQGSDVLVLHILDPAELTFPFERPTRFEDMETNAQVVSVPGLIRQHYLREIGALQERYRRELRLASVDYYLVDTSRPLDEALPSYLSTRGRRT